MGNLLETPQRLREERVGVRFRSGYQGAGTYEYKGRTYEVRHSADDWRPGVWNYTPEQYQAQYVALVGCIHFYYGTPHEFPPVELEAAFPGYVRARFRDDWTVEYAGGIAPETVHSDVYKGTLAKAWADEMLGYGWEV